MTGSAAVPPIEERYPWRVKCDTCGWVDHFATKDEATQWAAKHGPANPLDRHLVRVVPRA